MNNVCDLPDRLGIDYEMPAAGSLGYEAGEHYDVSVRRANTFCWWRYGKLPRTR